MLDAHLLDSVSAEELGIGFHDSVSFSQAKCVSPSRSVYISLVQFSGARSWLLSSWACHLLIPMVTHIVFQSLPTVLVCFSDTTPWTALLMPLSEKSPSRLIQLITVLKMLDASVQGKLGRWVTSRIRSWMDAIPHSQTHLTHRVSVYSVGKTCKQGHLKGSWGRGAGQPQSHSRLVEKDFTEIFPCEATEEKVCFAKHNPSRSKQRLRSEEECKVILISARWKKC